MTFSPAPKPTPRPKKVRKPLPRSWLKRGTKAIPRRNEKRIARKNVAYRKVIASDFHKKLRYDAYLRSGGLCECAECVKIRKVMTTAYVRGIGETDTLAALAHYPRTWPADRVKLAFTEIPVWLTRKGGEPWQRFRSKDGELHHNSYALFGDENPDELRLVRFVWKECHRRIEAEHHTRRRYLKGATR